MPFDDEPLSAELKAEILSILPTRIVGLRYLRHEYLGENPQYPGRLIIPDTPLWHAIINEANRRINKSPFIRVPLREGVRNFLHLHEHENELMVGAYSIIDNVSKIKYIRFEPFTPTELMSAYLSLCLAGRRMTMYHKKIDIQKQLPVNYFSGPVSGKLAYVDLKWAYWNILWPTAIDMSYDPISQTIESYGHLHYMYPEEFAQMRIPRLLVHGVFAHRTNAFWIPSRSRLIHRFIPSQLYRPYLVTYILDTMHRIAWEAKQKFTIHQWLTDAAILPENQMEEFRNWLLNEWFMTSRIIAHGDGDSPGKDMYWIGDKKTKHYTSSLKHKPEPVNNVFETNPELKTIRRLLLERYLEIDWSYLETVPPPRKKLPRFNGHALITRKAVPMYRKQTK